MGRIIYKICHDGEWQSAVAAGIYRGSADDKRDGFIHFSIADQLYETARRYYAGKRGLMLIAFDSTDLGGDLKWEPSRGGALFPHLYSDLNVTHALWAKPLPLDAAGVPIIPGDLA